MPIIYNIYLKHLMQISTRKMALQAQLGQYFTGQPCKYGHVTTRYTQSGACTACVAAAAVITRVNMKPMSQEQRDQVHDDRGARLAAARKEKDDRLAAVLAERDAMIAARNELVEVKVRSFPIDLAVLRETVLALGKARYPMLPDAEFAIQGRPTDQAAGTALYRFRVAAEDIDMIRSISNVLLDAHKVDVSGVHDRVARQVEQMAAEAASPTPEGWK